MKHHLFSSHPPAASAQYVMLCNRGSEMIEGSPEKLSRHGEVIFSLEVNRDGEQACRLTPSLPGGQSLSFQYVINRPTNSSRSGRLSISSF